MSSDKISAVGINIAEKATMIWNVADMLRGPFKPHEYGLVILPMTVVKRFHDCLLPTHEKVQEQYEKVKHLAVIDGFLTRASGYQFYNISKFTFETLLADPDNIETNFRDYLAGFSANAQDVLSKFDFDNIIKRMVESNTLYLVIKEFHSEKGYLGPDRISAVDCGYIFEDLVRRFSESFGEQGYYLPYDGSVVGRCQSGCGWNDSLRYGYGDISDAFLHGGADSRFKQRY